MAKRSKKIYNATIRRTDGNSIVSPDLKFQTDQRFIRTEVQGTGEWAQFIATDGTAIAVRKAWVIDYSFSPAPEAE